MLEYIKYLFLIYVGLYVALYLALGGKVTIGFISWLHLINVKINLKKINISIGSVSMQIRPMYYLHRKKLKATHHDGLIVIHFYSLKVLFNDGESETNSCDNSNKKQSSNKNQPMSNKKEKNHSFDKCINALQWLRYILPLTVVIHNLSIIKGDQLITFETLSTSFNCNLETNKHTKQRELRNSIHCSLSNLCIKQRKIIKDLKWTFAGATPISDVCSPKFSKLISSCVGHGINIHLDELKQLLIDFKPKTSINSNRSKTSTNSSKIDEKAIETYLTKFAKSDIYFAFDETNIESKDFRFYVKNMVYSINSAEKKDIVYKKYSSTKLFKLTVNKSGVKVFLKNLPNSKIHIEFFNFFSIWDLKSVIFSIRNIHNSDIIKKFTDDDSFIARSFLTITNITLFTTLNDIILFRKLKKQHLQKQNLKSDIPETIDMGSDSSNILLENLLRLTHKLRTRAQLLTTMVQVNLSESINSQFLIDDILLDSSLTDNLASLFEMDHYLTPTKSIFMAVRNMQLSIIENVVVHKLLIIDLFDASCSIAVSDDSVVIDTIILYIHHIEFLADNIDVFKKLALIANDVVNRKDVFDKPEEVEEVVPEVSQESSDYCTSKVAKPRKSSVLPHFINSFKFTIHRITLTACFKNPVKYWDGEDQTDLNNFKRGLSISILELRLLHDNTIDVPISNINLSEFTISLIRDYDTEKHKQKFTKILCLQKSHFRYTYLNNRLSVVFPILDITLSVEVLWTTLFVLTVLKSVTGRKNNSSEKIKLDKKPNERNKLPLSLLILFPLTMIKLKLPSDVELAFELDSLQYTKLPLVKKHDDIRFKVFRVYGQNPYANKFWTLLAIISNAHFKFTPNSKLTDNEAQIYVNCDDIRIEIPYEYVFYKTFDNLKAFFKSIKKLKLNFHDLMFIEETNRDFKVNVIMPSLVETPPRLPKICIKSKRIFYCNHDDPFEEELTACLMLGRMEQQVRLSKLKAFEKYEADMLKNLEEKYKNALTFENGKPIMPLQFKVETHRRSSPTPLSSGMKRSFSTGLLSPIHMNRRRDASISIGTSKLSNEVMNEECEAWYEYKREYHISIEIPRNRLNANISKSWIKRVKTCVRTKKSSKVANGNIKSDPRVRKEFLKKFPVVAEGHCQPLFGFKVMDAVLTLNEPEFGLENYADYMYRVAGGMPKDMKYGILLPMNLKLSSSSLDIQIKDYPLPLLGFGGGKNDGPEAVKFEGDLVICEQRYALEEIRYNFVSCVPQYKDERRKDSLYAFHIARTMTNVKFITDMNVIVDSSRSAAVSWAPSLQPGMTYAFNSFDLLSKPPLDISPKIGFWDKMPLLVPSKFTFHLKNGIALFIKSSQSPYHLIGKNAGFAFKWDKDVKVSVNSTGKPEDFLIVESQVFEIGVPLFDPEYVSSVLSFGKGTALDYKIAKVILKLTSKPIIWKLGFLFERNLNNEKHAKPGSVERSKNFRPHYDVQLRNPDTFLNDEEKENWDSYEGWRSDYIYLAVSCYSRDDNKCNELPNALCGSAFNSLYLTPCSLFYFFFWWNSFKSSLGLPIKMGNMFKNKFLSDQKAPKFGASIFGLTYSVDLSPLYLTHVYQHSTITHTGSKLAYTGLKCFVKSFTMDLHQCRREVTILDDKTNSVMKEYRLKMDKGIVDFVDADLRILTAVFDQTSTTGMLVKQLGLDKSNSHFSDSDSSSTNSDEFTSRAWYDHDDFIELENQVIPDDEPKWKVHEFASSPRFYYVRDADDVEVDYPFDLIETQTHNCQLGKRNLSQAASHLVDIRLNEIEDQINFFKNEIKDLESKPQNDYVQKTLDGFNDDLQELYHRLHVLRCLKDRFSEGIFPEYDEFLNDQEISDDEVQYALSKVASRVSSHMSRTKSRISTAPIGSSNYINRFSVYTINIKWTKQSKSGVLRYLEQIKEKRYLQFSMSQQAISLAEELRQTVAQHLDDSDPDFSFLRADPREELENSNKLLDDFDQALHDATGLLEAECEDTYLLKFILPQIAVTTNNNKCILLTSNQIVLRSITVKGYNIDSNTSEITIPMETRHGITLTDAFLYVLDRENVLTNKYRFFTPNACCWPPKLPVEMYYTPVSLDECVVIQDISLALLMIRPNKLHLAKNDHKRVKRETVRVISPEINLTVDSEQLQVLHEVFSSLLQHDETEIQKVKDAVKNFIKYSDFSDFNVLYSDLKDLQNEGRQLLECRRLMMNFNSIGNIDALAEIESINVELEKIFLNLNAIVEILQSTKNRKYNEAHEFTQWNVMGITINVSLVDEDKLPFVEISAIDTYYMFTDSPSGESVNTVFVYDFAIFDKHASASYETVATRLVDTEEPLFKMDWNLSAPVGGINIVEYEEFSCAPLRIEFDMKFADAIQKFLFPKSKILQNKTVFDDSDSDSLYDLDSISSEGTGLVRINSVTSDISIPPPGKAIKEVSKFSKALHKLMPKSHVSDNPQPSKPPTEEGTISFSTAANKKNINKTAEDNVKLMDERAKTYYMAKYVKINPATISVTFKGTGKFKIVNLSDFNIKTPTIEVEHRMMSNEELFSMVRNKIVHYVLRNAYGIIKSTLKTSKSSKGESSNPLINPVLKMKEKKAKKQIEDENENGHILRAVDGNKPLNHSHKHHKDGHRFHDTDLLEPRIGNTSSETPPTKRILLKDIVTPTQPMKINDHPVYMHTADDDSLFQSLDDVQEEEDQNVDEIL